MDWRKYEEMKRQIPMNLTPSEYEQAIKNILTIIEKEKEQCKI